MSEIRVPETVPEKVVLPLTHTIFMARDTPPLGEIQEISVLPALMDIQKDAAEVSCHGELAVDVAYHSKEGEGELHHAQINVPMAETLPDNWAGVNMNTSHIATENLSWQVLTSHALELVGTLVLTPAENKREKAPVVPNVPSNPNANVNPNANQEQFAEPPDNLIWNYSKPTAATAPLSEDAILEELAETQAELEFADDAISVSTLSAAEEDDLPVFTEMPIVQLSELMADLEEISAPLEDDGKREEVLREVSAELAEEILDGDLAHLEEAAAKPVSSDAVLENETAMPYTLNSPRPSNISAGKPYAVTESVGNEYRLKFYLPKKEENVPTMAELPNYSSAEMADATAEELDSSVFAELPEEHA